MIELVFKNNTVSVNELPIIHTSLRHTRWHFQCRQCMSGLKDVALFENGRHGHAARQKKTCSDPSVDGW